ncbi:MAG: hypothetical protein ACEPOZ_12945 [Marinifilaceae bacterium]
MKAIINSLLLMLVRLDKFIEKYSTLLKGQAQVNEILNLIDSEVTDLKQNISVQETTSKAYTKAKHQKKKQLAWTLIAIMSFLRNDALNKKNTVLAEAMTTTIQKLLNRMDAQLIAITEETIKVAEGMGEALPTIGIPVEDLEHLKLLTTEYKQAMVEPLEIRKQRKIATQRIKTQIKEIKNLIYQRLLPLAVSCFSKNHNNLVKELETLVQVDKIPSRKLAVRGKILEAGNKTPINHVWIEIPETSIRYRTHSQKGGFQISNLEPGHYTLKCQCDTHEPISQDFTHAYGYTTKLEIFMHPTPATMEERKKEREEEKRDLVEETN